MTIRDAGGLSVTSTVNVTVQQTLKSIVVTPGAVTVAVRSKTQFLAVALDQFGTALSTQPTFTWTLTGRGSLSSTGVYTAPNRKGGPYTISAKAGGIKGTAAVTVGTVATASTTAGGGTSPLGVVLNDAQKLFGAGR